MKNELIANEEICINSMDHTFAIAGLNVDTEGRVSIFNADAYAYQLIAAGRGKRKPLPESNTNCKQCNAVVGCGTINSVAGCGGKIREK